MASITICGRNLVPAFLVLWNDAIVQFELFIQISDWDQMWMLFFFFFNQCKIKTHTASQVFWTFTVNLTPPFFGWNLGPQVKSYNWLCLMSQGSASMPGKCAGKVKEIQSSNLAWFEKVHTPLVKFARWGNDPSAPFANPPLLTTKTFCTGWSINYNLI